MSCSCALETEPPDRYLFMYQQHQFHNQHSGHRRINSEVSCISWPAQLSLVGATATRIGSQGEALEFKTKRCCNYFDNNCALTVNMCGGLWVWTHNYVSLQSVLVDLVIFPGRQSRSCQSMCHSKQTIYIYVHMYSKWHVLSWADLMYVNFVWQGAVCSCKAAFWNNHSNKTSNCTQGDCLASRIEVVLHSLWMTPEWRNFVKSQTHQH